MTAAPAFDPIRTYDVPEIVLARALDATLTAEDVRFATAEAFGGPPRLSINQRADIAAKLGEMPNPLMQAFVNVATNPLSWLVLLAGVPAGNAAGDLFRVSARRSAAVMRNAPLLHVLGLANGSQITRGTPLAAFVDEYADGFKEWVAAIKTLDGGGTRRFLERHRALELAEQDLLRVDELTGRKAEVLREVNTLLGIRINRLNKDRNRYVLRASRDSEGRIAKFEAIRADPDLAIVRAPDEVIDRRLRELGADGILEDLLHTRRRAFELLFLDEHGRIDPEKIARIHASRDFYNQGSLESMKHSALGDNAISHLFGDDMVEALREGRMTKEGLYSLVEETLGKVLKGNEEFYLPRNVYRITDAQGRELPRWHPLRHRSARIQTGVLEITNAARERQIRGHALDPEDLDDIQRFLPAYVNPEAMEVERKRIRKSLETAAKEGNGAARFQRLRPMQQMARYSQSAGRTYALFARAPTERSLALQRQILGDLRRSEHAEEILGRGERLRGSAGRPEDPDAHDILTPFSEAKATPPGGFTVADGIDASFRLINPTNRYARRYVQETLVPLLMGRASPNDLAGSAIKSFTQSTAESFLRTDLGRMLRESKDPRMRAFHDGLRRYAESTIDDIGGNWSASMARWFYVTHLGLNMGSVLNNLTQPLVTTARWVGGGDLLRGYGRAFRQYFDYVEDRLRLGAHVTPEAREALHRKHFRLFDELGLAENSAFELLDSTLQKTGLFRSGGPGSRFDRFTAFMMGPFQNTEIFNRLVTAEAFAAKAERLGKPLTDPLVRAEIRRGVMESQFGASLLNTPAAFLDRRSFLSNPLVKQFLQFPTRMFTSVFEIGATAGGTDSAALGILRDIARGTGISAIGYETLKAFNVDASDVGFLESSSQLFTGFVDERDGPLPVPPVISIASDTAKLLTGQDNDFFKYTLPRLVPGGLALSRALNVLPDISGGNPTISELVPQRRVARWDMRTPDGLVPVFDTQGRFLEMQDGLQLLMGGLGLDMGAYRDRAQLDRFLLTQREEISRVRREFRRRLFANDYRGARELQDKFRRRFGFELRLKRAEIIRDQKLRSVARVERILDQLPPEIRPQLAATVAATREDLDRINYGGSPEEFVQAPTSRARDELRRFQLRIPAPPEHLRDTLLEESAALEYEEPPTETPMENVP